LKMGDDFCFKFQPSMIATNMNFHRISFDS
jgi:hypothetical protein